MYQVLQLTTVLFTYDYSVKETSRGASVAQVAPAMYSYGLCSSYYVVQQVYNSKQCALHRAVSADPCLPLPAVPAHRKHICTL